MEADLEEVAAHGEGGADTTIDELWADLVGAHAIQIGTELQTFEMTLGEHVVSAIMAAAEEAEVAAEAAGGAEAAPAELATRLRRLRCLDVRMSTFQFWDAIAMTLDGRCEGFGRPNAGSATPEEDCAAYRAAVEVREAWRRGAPEALSLAQRAAPLLETIGEEPPSEVVFEDITDLCPHFEPETSSAD